MKGLNMGFGLKKSKSGFTLIELLIVMVILAILVGVIVMAVGGVFGQAGKAAYNSSREEMKNAVVSYSVDHAGAFPTLAGNHSVTGCTDCRVVNVSALLTSNGGMLSAMPQGMFATNATGTDNCNGVAGIGCLTTNSYVWIIDTYGNLYSRCLGSGCSSNTTTGYQGVWP